MAAKSLVQERRADRALPSRWRFRAWPDEAAARAYAQRPGLTKLHDMAYSSSLARTGVDLLLRMDDWSALGVPLPAAHPVHVHAYVILVGFVIGNV